MLQSPHLLNGPSLDSAVAPSLSLTGEPTSGHSSPDIYDR